MARKYFSILNDIGVEPPNFLSIQNINKVEFCYHYIKLDFAPPSQELLWMTFEQAARGETLHQAGPRALVSVMIFQHLHMK